MASNRYLEKNTAPWDRLARAVIGALLAAGAPLVLASPWWCSLLGIVAGFQFIAASTGF